MVRGERPKARCPSVPVSLSIEYEINSITGTERSEDTPVATLHTAVSRLRVSKTCSVPAHTLFQCRALRRQDQEHLPPAPRYPSPKNHARSRLTFPPPFLLDISLLKGPCSERIYQVASTIG